MQKIVIEIPDNKFKFIMELLKSLSFVKIQDEVKLTQKQQEFVAGTKEALEQVNKHLKGEITLKSADQLLDEL